jgi:tripartite-type tricarboxylate transporter receptor subunit TctC
MHASIRRRGLIGGLAAVAFCIAMPPARAQDYPGKPVRLIVPFPPGGSVDYVARVISAKFGESLGQSVVVDNRGGASGTIGTYEAARAPADGYTLLLAFDTHAVNGILYNNLRYDSLKSFDFLSLVGTLPIVLATSKQSGFDSLPKLLAAARAQPGRINYGTTGGGGANHPNAAAFERAAGIRFTHVPYRGGGALSTAVLAGEVDVFMPSLPTAISLVKAGRINAVGIGTPQRQAQLPDVPPISELVPGYVAESWVGLMAPAGLPKEVSARILEALHKALDAPEVKTKLQSEGFNIVVSTPAQFEQRVKADMQRWNGLMTPGSVTAE